MLVSISKAKKNFCIETLFDFDGDWNKICRFGKGDIEAMHKMAEIDENGLSEFVILPSEYEKKQKEEERVKDEKLKKDDTEEGEGKEDFDNVTNVCAVTIF